jgi:predicted secreted protein
MNLASGIAIYFIIWWLVLFLVLPFGIRNAHETGETVEEGHEPGAPSNPRILRKAVVTTILATTVFAIFYVAKTQGWLNLDTLPFYNTMPSPTG